MLKLARYSDITKVSLLFSKLKYESREALSMGEGTTLPMYATLLPLEFELNWAVITKKKLTRYSDITKVSTCKALE